jgi:hypothetical protein
MSRVRRKKESIFNPEQRKEQMKRKRVLLANIVAFLVLHMLALCEEVGRRRVLRARGASVL